MTDEADPNLDSLGTFARARDEKWRAERTAMVRETQAARYIEVLEVSDDTTISVSREKGEIFSVVKIFPALFPNDAVWSRLSDTERVTLIQMLTGAGSSGDSTGGSTG